MRPSAPPHPFAAPRSARPVARVLVAVAVTLCALLANLPAASAAPVLPEAAESEFVFRLNQARLAHGKAPLVVNFNLRRDARNWSGTMAYLNQLFHTSTLSADTSASVPGWSRSGENVGRGWGASSLHDAFMNSPLHKENVLGDFNQVGIGVVHRGDEIFVTVRFAKGPLPAFTGTGTPDGNLWLADSRGAVFNFGTAHLGDARNVPLSRPIVGMTSTPSSGGYWLVATDGGIFAYGDARFYGSTGGMRLNQPINGMARTPSGGGYWLVASDGGIFAYGDAGFYGSTGSLRLNRPVNGMATTPRGDGYWLVASDGGIFAFGSAGFYGSAAGPGSQLGAPTVGITTSPSGNGYLIAASNGRVGAFGDAQHRGDANGLALPAPIVRIQMTADGGGYWLVGADGAVYPFGNAGSRMSAPLAVSGSIEAVARR